MLRDIITDFPLCTLIQSLPVVNVNGLQPAGLYYLRVVHKHDKCALSLDNEQLDSVLSLHNEQLLNDLKYPQYTVRSAIISFISSVIGHTKYQGVPKQNTLL